MILNGPTSDQRSPDRRARLNTAPQPPSQVGWQKKCSVPSDDNFMSESCVKKMYKKKKVPCHWGCKSHNRNGNSFTGKKEEKIASAAQLIPTKNSPQRDKNPLCPQRTQVPCCGYLYSLILFFLQKLTCLTTLCNTARYKSLWGSWARDHQLMNQELTEGAEEKER